MVTRRHSMMMIASALAAPSLVRATEDPPFLTQRVSHTPPYCIKNDDGTWTGFEIEMSRNLCRLVGIEVKPADEYLAWARALKAMQAGDLIQLLPAASFREERTAFLDYICPFDLEQTVVVMRKENAHVDFASMEDFAVPGRMFERVEGAVLYPPFDKRYAEDPEFAAHFVEMSNSGAGESRENRISLARRVHRGRVFGVVTEWSIAYDISKLTQDQLGFSPDELVAVPVKVFGTPVTYLTASKTLSQGLRDKLRLAGEQTRDNGQYEETWTKWYGTRPMPPRT